MKPDLLDQISAIASFIADHSDRSINLNSLLGLVNGQFGSQRAFILLRGTDERTTLAAAAGLNAAEFRRLDSRVAAGDLDVLFAAEELAYLHSIERAAEADRAEACIAVAPMRIGKTAAGILGIESAK